MTPPQWQAHRGRIPAGANYGVDQDGAHVAEEELVGHGVTRIQDDLRQQVEEEDSRGQGEGRHVVCRPNDPTQEEAEADEQGALRDHAGHVVVGFDDCKKRVVFLRHQTDIQFIQFNDKINFIVPSGKIWRMMHTFGKTEEIQYQIKL